MIVMLRVASSIIIIIITDVSTLSTLCMHVGWRERDTGEVLLDGLPAVVRRGLLYSAVEGGRLRVRRGYSLLLIDG